MSFPVPQSSVTPEGPQRSGVELANAASDARRQTQIRHALTQHTNQPQMVTTTHTPSEAELSKLRNERVRLLGDHAVHYKDQLAAIAQEKENTSARLSSYRRQREAALRQGHIHDAKRFGSLVDDLALVIEQLSLLENDAQVALIGAEEREARQQVVFEQQVAQAKKTYADFLKERPDYDQHAAAIASLVKKEPAALAARRVLQEAGLSPVPFPLTPGGKTLRATVTLPGHCQPPARPPSPNDAYSQ